MPEWKNPDTLQKWQLGFLVSLYLFVQNLPQSHMWKVIFSPIQFLPILLLKERYVQVQALQQKVPGSHIPNLSRSLLRDSTSLFLWDKALKVSSSETSSCWSGVTDLAYPLCVEVPCWLFQGPIVTRVTFCWDALNSLSHHEPYFKLLELAWSLDLPLLSPDIKNKLAPSNCRKWASKGTCCSLSSPPPPVKACLGEKKKSDTKDHILYDFICMKCPK